MMKPCNILIDGNFLFHSEFAVYTAYNRTNKFSSERDEIAYIQGVANKLFFALGHLPNSGKIIFCTDSKSWRKGAYPGYKASREDADGNKGMMDKETKDKFYKLMDEFTKTLEKVGIVSSRIPGAESDDLIFKWVKHFNDKGENSIIISGDGDMAQLVRMGSDAEPWVIQWNNDSKNNKMFVPAGWNESWLSKSSSIFEMGSSEDRQVIKRHITNFAIQLKVVDPSAVVLEKILTGDKGDDVPPAWRYKGKTKEGKDKVVNLSDGVATKVVAYVQEKYRIDYAGIMARFKENDTDFLADMAGIILRTMKTVDGTNERKAVIESLLINRTLVHLSEDVIVGNVQAAIEDHIDLVTDNLRMVKNKWNKKGIFEGTRFSENAPQKRDDPFAYFEIPE